MSWSVVVDDVDGTTGFTTELLEHYFGKHPKYPEDIQATLAFAKAVGLKSATLSGGRTPNPYGGDEVVTLSVVGFPKLENFVLEMRNNIFFGPGPESAVGKHQEAVARLKLNNCEHDFQPIKEQPGVIRCTQCKVYVNGGLLYFDDSE